MRSNNNNNNPYANGPPQAHYNLGAAAQNRDQQQQLNDISTQRQQQPQTQNGQRSRSGGDQSDIQLKLKALVTQVPQGQINPMPVMNNQNTPKYRSKTQGGNVKVLQGSFRPKIQKGISYGLLGPQPEKNKGMKTLVLDLDETLVHSQFNQIKNPDYIIPVDIEGNICNIFVQKRPGVDNFLKVMSQYYEVVIFTASLSKYADPLMNQMDTNTFCTMRLFREHCTYINGVFTKDMSKIGRNAKDAMILDNSPSAYMLQPEQAVPIISWYEDPKDRQLFDLIPLFIQLSQIDDCREAITRFVKNNQVDFALAKQVCDALLERQEREKQFQAQQQMKIQKHIEDQQKQSNQPNFINSNAKNSKEQNIRDAEQKQGQSFQKENVQQQTYDPSDEQNNKKEINQAIKKRQKSENQNIKQKNENTNQEMQDAQDEQISINKQKIVKQEVNNSLNQKEDGNQNESSQKAQGKGGRSVSANSLHQSSPKQAEIQKPLINPFLKTSGATQNQNQSNPQNESKIQKQKFHQQSQQNDTENSIILRNQQKQQSLIQLSNQNQNGPQGQININQVKAEKLGSHNRFQSSNVHNIQQQEDQKLIAGSQKRKGVNGYIGPSVVNYQESQNPQILAQTQTPNFQAINFTQAEPQIQSVAAAPQPPQANPGVNGNGVTNITNIILSISQTIQKPQNQVQEHYYQLFTNQNNQQQIDQANKQGQDVRQINTQFVPQNEEQINGITPTNQKRRLNVTQGGNRPRSSKKNSGNGINYPVINVNNTAQQKPPQVEPVTKRLMMQSHQQMHSLDRSQQLQVSQGLSISESYKEQAQQIQNQIKRRPQTGGNNQQINQGDNEQNQIQEQMYRQLQLKTANHSQAIAPQVNNKRSISGASNKNQFNLNAIKGQSSTPKNQNLTNGIGNFRSNDGALQLVNPQGAPVQRFGNQIKNMTQVINMKDHFPADLRGNSNNQNNMHQQRIYMAQQKLAKQLKLNTNNDQFLRYGQQQKNSQQMTSNYFNGQQANAGNITTTASQQKSNGSSIFNFGQNSYPRSGASLRGSNKQRSHSSSNNAGTNPSNIVFIGSQNQQNQGNQVQFNYQQMNSQNKDASQVQMIAASSNKIHKQITSHGRNNSDINGNQVQRQQDFMKDQKLLAAESAIADQYATAVLNNISSTGHRNFLANNSSELPDQMVNFGSSSGISAMPQSYRNVGGVISNIANTQKPQGTSGHSNIYEKLRNSYQNPNQFLNQEIITNASAVGNSVGNASFHNQKSPKISGHPAIKQIKYNGIVNGSSQNGFQQSNSNQLGGYQQQKNVKIMLVGNNGVKGSPGGQQSFKANIIDQNGMQFIGGNGVGTLPKTTKNNITKFYTQGGASQDLSSGFLNALSTPQSKQNSFRTDGIRGVILNNNQSVNMTLQNAADHSNGLESLNVRQSAQVDKEGASINGNGQKNTNSQQFQNLHFNQAIMLGQGSLDGKNRRFIRS